MKILRFLTPFITALAFAAPATSMANRDLCDHGHDGGHWDGGHHDFHGGDHDHHFSPGFRGRYFDHGRSYFYGGGSPYFWGPGLGFSFYGGPAYYEDAGDFPGYYRESRSARGSVSEDLGEEVQRALTERGFYHGPVDGEIGPASRAAIRAYQNKHGLEPTGRIDASLLRFLRI